jgi:CBS domain-containing protein
VEHKIGGLPIVEDGRLVGIITTSDLLGTLMEIEGEATSPLHQTP